MLLVVLSAARTNVRVDHGHTCSPHKPFAPDPNGNETDNSQEDQQAAPLAPSPSPTPITTTYANQQIETLSKHMPAGFCLVVEEVDPNKKPFTLRGLRAQLLKKQFPEDGSLWLGGLLRWLRSNTVVQVVNLWAQVRELGLESWSILP